MNFKKRARPTTGKTAAFGQPQGRSLLGAGCLGLLVGLVVAAVYFAFRSPSSTDQVVNGSRPPTHALPRDASHPAWGVLVRQNLNIERPEEYVPEILGIPPRTVWFIGAQEVGNLQKVVLSADLTEAQRDDLSASNRWHAVPNGWEIFPSTNTVNGLSRRARSQIYSILAKFSENPSHMYPYRFPLSREKEWFNNSGLSAPLEEAARQMVYEHGRLACFSDLEIMNRITDPKESQQLIRVLSREPAVFVKLRVHHDDDIDRLVQYWEKAKPRKDIEPFLASLARSPDENDVSLAYFLPPFARTRLYCYPDQVNNELNAQDCFWSALNFFYPVPDNKFLVPAARDEALKKDYQPVKTPPTLGDLVILVDKNGHALHACVYLADNIVFTKNGATRLSPWLLMEMDDMLAYYCDEAPTVLVLRPKAIPGKSSKPRVSMLRAPRERLDD